jgi:ribonuclease J
MNIIIHRGTKEVGGSCVEINCKDTCILVDFGLPLTFDISDDINSVLPEPLYSNIVNGNKKIDALLLSHAHLDHYGLIGRLPKDIPIYMSNAALEIIRFTDEFTPNKIGHIEPVIFRKEESFKVGSFDITPYSADHSAFDSYAFLITGDHKSLFYSGDFRGHGHKHKQFDNLISNPPKVDLLLMEGTLVGKRIGGQVITETEVEKQISDLCQQTKGAVFVTVPSQNIDRIISIYRAAKKIGRKFIIDLNSAELFDRLGKYSDEIPQASWPDVLLWCPWFQEKMLHDHGADQLIEKYENLIKSIQDLSPEIPRSVMILCPPFRKEIENNADLSGSVWVYSMWKGYLERREPLKKLKNWAEYNGIPFKFLHTTGHAQIPDLQQLAKILSPRVLIPIHSDHAELFSGLFENVHQLEDGEKLEV